MVNHDPRYRRSWMLPRNIRKIYPWKINQLISIFAEYGAMPNWQTDQDLQNKFSKTIADAGLKDGNNIRDPKSGGARTYKSQLELLGLIYESSNKETHLTIAGEKIYNGEAPLPILQHLLMSFQYPSVYSKSAGVKINPEIKVKPFHFTMKIINDPRINGLANSEFSVPVLFGHTNTDLENCISTILEIRKKRTNLVDMITNDPTLAYTTRTANRDALSATNDIKDIGNTLKNYLESCHLIFFDEPNDVYQLTEESAQLLLDHESSFDVFLNINQTEENFQREFGVIGQLKDSRRKSTELKKISITKTHDAEEETIKRLLRKEINENPTNFSISNFISDCSNNYGLNPGKVQNIYNEFHSQFIDQFEATFLALANGGSKTATEFEKTVTRLFNEIDGVRAKHIGQKHRSAGTGGYTDILIDFENNNQFGLADAKAYKVYAMDSNDFAKITSNYIPNAKELVPNKKLIFFTIIAGGLKQTINKRLLECSNLTNVPTSAISAKVFLELCKQIKENKISLDKFIKPFLCKEVVTYENLENYLN